MLTQQFLSDYRHALEYATEIFKKVFYEKVEDPRFEDAEYNEETGKYDILTCAGYASEDSYESFPAIYLTMSIQEIQLVEEKKAELAKIAELKRLEEEKPNAIENAILNIKTFQNSVKSHKKRYFELTGREYSE